MYKLIVLSVIAFSAVAQVQQPPPPAPFLLSNLPPHATQKVVAQTSVAFYPGSPNFNCSTPNFYEACLIMSSIGGGNVYDGKGNFYFPQRSTSSGLWESLWKRTPQGTFPQFARVPHPSSCNEKGTTFYETFGGADLLWVFGFFPSPSNVFGNIGPASLVLNGNGAAWSNLLFSVNAAESALEILTVSSSAVFVPATANAGYCNSFWNRFNITGTNTYNAYQTVTIAIVQVTLPSE